MGPPVRRTDPRDRTEAEKPYCPAEHGEQLVCEVASRPVAEKPSGQLTQAALLVLLENLPVGQTVQTPREANVPGPHGKHCELRVEPALEVP